MAVFRNKLLKGVETAVIEADNKGHVWFSMDNTKTGVQIAVDTNVSDLRDFAVRILANCDAIESDPSKLSRGKVGESSRPSRVQSTPAPSGTL